MSGGNESWACWANDEEAGEPCVVLLHLIMLEIETHGKWSVTTLVIRDLDTNQATKTWLGATTKFSYLGFSSKSFWFLRPNLCLYSPGN